MRTEHGVLVDCLEDGIEVHAVATDNWHTLQGWLRNRLTALQSWDASHPHRIVYDLTRIRLFRLRANVGRYARCDPTTLGLTVDYDEPMRQAIRSSGITVQFVVVMKPSLSAQVAQIVADHSTPCQRRMFTSVGAA